MAHGEGGGTIAVSNRGPVTFFRSEAGAPGEPPMRVAGLATVLNAAPTTTGKERMRLSRALRDRVKSNTTGDWVGAQTRDIEAYREPRG